MSEKLESLKANVSAWRALAKSAYKAWKLTPDDSKVMQKYANAWEEYSKANRAYFLEDCEE